MFKAWIKAVRAPFFTASIISILLGTSIAWSEKNSFNLFYFFLNISGIVLIHSGSNLMNDYFDHLSGNDWENNNTTPFSGGSRVIQEKLIKPRQIFNVAVILFLLSIIIGLYLNNAVGGYTVLLFGIIGISVGFFYTAVPIKIGYRGFGLGEFTVGLMFGPLVVIGSYFVQTGKLSILPLIASVPIGILVSLILLINEFPDYKADAKVEKNTLPVILGRKRAAKLYVALLFFTYLYSMFFILTSVIPVLSMVILITAPLSMYASRIALNHYDEIEELVSVCASTIKIHLIFGLLLTISFAVSR